MSRTASVRMLRTLSEPAQAEAPLAVARGLVERGHHAVRAGQWDRAFDDLERGLSLAHALHSPELVAQGLLNSALAEIHSGDPTIGADLARAACAQFGLAQMPGLALAAETVEHFVSLDDDSADVALHALTALRERASTAPGPGAPSEGRLLGYIGNALRALGKTSKAKALYASAMARLDVPREQAFVSVFAMDSALCDLLDGEASLGLAALLRAEQLRRTDTPDQRYVQYLIAHYGALTALLSGALRDDPPKMPGAPWQSSRIDYLESTRIFAARFAGRSGSAPGVRALTELKERCPAFDHARISLRLCVLAGKSHAAAGNALAVGPRASYFELPHLGRVSLEGRAGPRKLLEYLVAMRLARPGDPVLREELVAAAWPGEKMCLSAQRNRVHVALSSLRSLGLREVLRGDARGYWIDRDVSVLCVAA